jgi:hypothetical protein
MKLLIRSNRRRGSTIERIILIKRIKKQTKRRRWVDVGLLLQAAQMMIIPLGLVAKIGKELLEGILDSPSTIPAMLRRRERRRGGSTTRRSRSSISRINKRSSSSSTTHTTSGTKMRAQVPHTVRRMRTVKREAMSHNLLDDMHELRSIGQRLVRINSSFLNLEPHKVRDAKAATISTKANHDLGSIMLNVYSFSNLGIDGVAEQVIEHIEIWLEKSSVAIRMLSRLIHLSCLHITLINTIDKNVKQARSLMIITVKTKQAREGPIVTAVVDTLCHPM